jgi:hypothetical protein
MAWGEQARAGFLFSGRDSAQQSARGERAKCACLFVLKHMQGPARMFSTSRRLILPAFAPCVCVCAGRWSWRA